MRYAAGKYFTIEIMSYLLLETLDIIVFIIMFICKLKMDFTLGFELGLLVCVLLAILFAAGMCITFECRNIGKVNHWQFLLYYNFCVLFHLE